MPIQAVKTTFSEAAVNHVKSATKRRVYTLNKEIPAEIAAKRIYMQSDEFLNDPHNVKMFELADELIIYRDKIANDIKEYNKNAKYQAIQGVNGFARIKQFLKTNPVLNFWETMSFGFPNENKYYMMKECNIRLLAKQAKSALEKV